MPRPRVHDLDEALDVVERLAVEGGPSAVTVRAVAAATEMSNGAIYHAFGSRGGLVGRAWLRAAHRFLDLQQASVERALERGAVDAVVAAADTPAVFAEKFPQSSRFLLAVRRDELLGSDIPEDVDAELSRLDSVLVALFVRLARALWGRKDGRAVEVIEACVVGLPTGLLLQARRKPDAAMRQRLETAVRAVLTLDPPPPRKRHDTDTKGPS
ncbi:MULTISPECIES: TetR family transcriptional regulator [unclassified Rhodococcus (in: high G+C Gram-positive bacteria)]|uniref:TetR family transcriptional regulator n=1 Tax=unclassified Rhodococcus (in: high G+C Gram-positive bacteria) TaxID=192944 RepID=UPI001639A273|nr:MULTISPECIES: TetR family transcriptional regulator [unclassified Rhodococcus (in: high G+C Gram-positive bacteria)]MBC2641252.1 TetR family transcriptional regulator [Rhodococcus sp. 3A]MBC2894003.1 TetR family transcriptional regulator [Rhodococcus sp. 4CII]